MKSLIHAAMFYSVYFAPRGRERLLFLGEQISHRHLSFEDRLIGIIGDAGSGKSSLIKGMFPGLELINDDDRLDSHKIMRVRENFDSLNDATTFHLDMRFQLAFTQMHEIITFVKNALKHERRVIIEHFDLLYPALKMKAEIMIGIGEEIIVTRPGVFGPLPSDIHDIVHNSLKYRKMVHSAEDITTMLLEREYGLVHNWKNSDVRRGFVLVFDRKPKLSLEELEKKVKDIIGQNIAVAYNDEDHIKFGNYEPVMCNGPRIHVSNTGEIENFRLLKEFRYDSLSKSYSLVGLVGTEEQDVEDLNRPRLF